MPATTSLTTLWSAQTLTAGAGDANSSAEDIRDVYGGICTLRITNGATGPTVPAYIRLEVSYDNSVFFNWTGNLTGGVANNGVYQWTFPRPIGVMYIRAAGGGNTAQNVTVDALISEVTAL